MIIRELLDNELPTLAEIDKAVNLSPWSLINYEQSFVNQNHHIVGIFTLGSKLCGGITYSQVANESEILQLCIAREHQRQGYAAKLLRAIMLRLGLEGINQVFLEVMIDNNPAINLYQNCGFNVVTTRKNYYLIGGQRFDALIMGKTLCHD